MGGDAVRVRFQKTTKTFLLLSATIDDEFKQLNLYLRWCREERESEKESMGKRVVLGAERCSFTSFSVRAVFFPSFVEDVAPR